MRYPKDHKTYLMKLLESKKQTAQFKKDYFAIGFNEMMSKYHLSPKDYTKAVNLLGLPSKRKTSIWRGVNTKKPNYTMLNFKIMIKACERAYGI